MEFGYEGTRAFAVPTGCWRIIREGSTSKFELHAAGCFWCSALRPQEMELCASRKFLSS